MNKTVSIGGRVDIRSLATCAIYLDDLNAAARTKSDLLWKVVKMVANAAKQSGVREFDTVEDALECLKVHGLDIRSNDRGRKMVGSALQEEVMQRDFGAGLSSRVITKEMLTKTPREEYEAAADAARSMGIEPITFEEFCAGKAQAT